MIVAASDIATRIGVLDTATNAAMVLVAIISAALAPLLFNILVDRKAPILANAEASGAGASAPPIHPAGQTAAPRPSLRRFVPWVPSPPSPEARKHAATFSTELRPASGRW